MYTFTTLPDITELDWDASVAYAQQVVLAAGASGWLANKMAREALADLHELVVLMAACRQVVAWFEQLPARAPVISAPIAPCALTLDGVLGDWARHAAHEGALAAQHKDPASVAYAAARLRAITRAREALGKAANAGRTLATFTPSGALIVAGNGGHYLVLRQGVKVSCDCPHGQRLAAAERGETDDAGKPIKAPAGVCWHLILREAFEEGIDWVLSSRDATTVAPTVAA